MTVTKLTAVCGGGDWTDASVDFVVILCDASVEELFKEYVQRPDGPYVAFQEWMVDKGYAREANDSEIQVFHRD